MDFDSVRTKRVRVGQIPQNTPVEMVQFLQTLAEIAEIVIHGPGITKAVRREDLEWWTGLLTLTRRMRLGPSGGLMVLDSQGNDPVGGDMGAGTINIATGIYLNGVAYTSP